MEASKIVGSVVKKVSSISCLLMSFVFAAAGALGQNTNSRSASDGYEYIIKNDTSYRGSAIFSLTAQMRKIANVLSPEKSHEMILSDWDLAINRIENSGDKGVDVLVAKAEMTKCNYMRDLYFEYKNSKSSDGLDNGRLATMWLDNSSVCAKKFYNEKKHNNIDEIRYYSIVAANLLAQNFTMQYGCRFSRLIYLGVIKENRDDVNLENRFALNGLRYNLRDCEIGLGNFDSAADVWRDYILTVAEWPKDNREDLIRSAILLDSRNITDGLVDPSKRKIVYDKLCKKPESPVKNTPDDDALIVHLCSQYNWDYILGAYRSDEF